MRHIWVIWPALHLTDFVFVPILNGADWCLKTRKPFSDASTSHLQYLLRLLKTVSFLSFIILLHSLSLICGLFSFNRDYLMIDYISGSIHALPHPPQCLRILCHLFVWGFDLTTWIFLFKGIWFDLKGVGSNRFVYSGNGSAYIRWLSFSSHSDLFFLLHQVFLLCHEDSDLDWEEQEAAKHPGDPLHDLQVSLSSSSS